MRGGNVGEHQHGLEVMDGDTGQCEGVGGLGRMGGVAVSSSPWYEDEEASNYIMLQKLNNRGT